MRSVTEVRRRWLETIRLVILRPGMYAGDGRQMETVVRTLLHDLCFLDEREDDLQAVTDVLRRYGKTGVPGAFHATFGTDRGCVDEVASVYAEQFHRLGYLEVGRELGDAEWQTLLRGVRERFEGRDVRRSEFEDAFGSPSLVVGKRVLCYASAEGWAFFDFWDEPMRRYNAGEGNYEIISDPDPLVRSVRVPADDFDRGLVLTLYGKVLRWGPGWWIHHPPADASAESLAIAAQLRGIEAADPSQRPR